MNPQRCVLYARLSVTTEESVSIARQLDACRAYATGRGWEVVGEFIDDGVSATANRPQDRKGWAALLATPGFDAVIVWKVDRLARRVLDFLHADETLQGRGAGLVAVEDPIDMTTPMGRAFATILAVFGEMEAAAISARVRAARDHLRKQGRWTGGGVPYGYKPVENPDGAGWVLVKDPDRVGWLTQIVGRARAGHTITAITTWADQEGAPLPDKAATRQPGRPAGWNRQTVDGILRNPILAGMTRHNPGRSKTGKRLDPFKVVRDEAGDPVIDLTLAILTLAEFTALQEALAARDTPQARPMSERARTSPFLSRVVVCDDCDVFLCRGTNQSRPVLYCPTCRQVISRAHLDPHLEERLLTERGDEPSGGVTVRDQWRRAWADDPAKRQVLLSQAASIRVRRGVVGRYFDPDRVLITWKTAGEEEGAA